MPTEPTTPTVLRYQEPVDAHLILRRGNEVLLARRAGSPYANGLLNCVSGHVDGAFEDIVTTLVREAGEEAGIDVDPADVRAAVVLQHLNPHGAQRTGWFFEVTRWKGEPRICEPTLCSELGWFPLDRLPDDMVAYCRAGLDAYRNGQHIALHRQEPGDPIAYLPGGPDRTRYLQLSTPAQAEPDRPTPCDQLPSHQAAEKLEPAANALFGVAVIVHNTVTGEVLLGESARFPGLIEAVGGKPEPDEDLRATVARELAEEAGLTADPADVQLHAMVIDQRGGLPRATVVASLTRFTGTPEPREPHLIRRWTWHPLDDVPQPLFKPSLDALSVVFPGLFQPEQPPHLYPIADGSTGMPRARQPEPSHHETRHD